MDNQRKIEDALETIAEAVREGTYPDKGSSFVSMQNFPLICAKIANIDRTLTEAMKDFRENYVTKDRFNPIERGWYGMVAVVLLTVVGALIMLVIKK